jgi:HK97 family phage major capsid protein
MNYRALAERSLEKRSEIFEKRKNAAKAGKRDLVAEYDRQMDDLATEAREYVEFAENQNEIRGLMRTDGGRTLSQARNGEAADGEWRALLPGRTEMAEQRAENGTTYLIPEGTANKYVGMLSAKAVFLRGIPAENLLAFEDRKWTLPVLSDSDMPALVAENALIAENDDDWTGIEFDSKAYKSYRTVGNETLADSAVALRDVLGKEMIANCAVEFDNDAFNGAGPSDDTNPTPVLGLIGQGITTEVGSASGDTATFDDIASAIGRIWSGNGEPSVIWLDPLSAIALATEREGENGAYLADSDSAVGLARKLPQLVSTNVPSGTVVVADGSRVFAGSRENARVDISDHAHFQNDKTGIRLRMRAAGVYVVESSSVQVLAPNDGA